MKSFWIVIDIIKDIDYNFQINRLKVGQIEYLICP